MELHPLKYYSVHQPRDKTGNVLTSELIISTLKPRLGKFSMVFSSVFSILFLACSVSVRKERCCLKMLKETVFIGHFEAQGKLGDVFSLKTTTWCHSRQQRPRPTLINQKQTAGAEFCGHLDWLLLQIIGIFRERTFSKWCCRDTLDRRLLTEVQYVNTDVAWY